MKRHFLLKRIFLIGCCLFVTGFFAVRVSAMIADIDEGELFLLKGDLETIKTDGLTRVSITDPDVADLASIDSDQILLLAKTAGQTTLFAWDNSGKRTVLIHVFEENLNLVKSRIEYLLAKIKLNGISLDINDQEGKVVISGEVPEDKNDRFQEILDSFSGSILNLVQEKTDNDLIQIDCQIAEINSAATKKLGVDWTAGSALTYKETLPSGNIDKPWDAFRLGEFKRTTAIQNVLNALITEGEGHILSRPKLVVKSGEEASFLVGGQIPVTTRTLQDNNIIENVIYKDYGVDLTVTPTITEDDQIDIDLNIDISDIDATQPVEDEVAFTNRTAQTRLVLNDGQTVVLAGLIKKNRTENYTRIPILSDVPLFGALFRSKSVSPDTDTEVVISLTPTILRQDKRKAIVKRSLSRGFVAGAGPAAYTSSLPSSGLSAAAVSGQGTRSNSAISPEMMAYVQVIQNKIAQNISYPAQARRYGWEGNVKLNLDIASNGTLIYASIKDSSGYDLFDQDALMTAKRLAPYPGFPAKTNLQELNITIPIIYSLDAY